MKRSLIILAAILTLLLCSCQNNEDTNTSVYGDDISKAQEIVVVSSDTSEVIETITDKKDIEDFVLALDLDEWKLRTLPDKAAEIGSFGLSQEETIKFGQTDTDGTLYHVATITLYNNSYISFKVGGIDMTFEVSEDTEDYLNGYFK